MHLPLVTTDSESPQFFRHVLYWLAIPFCLTSVLYILSGRLGDVELREDSTSYLEMCEDGLFRAKSLRVPRTLGYPALLSSMRVLGMPLHWLPLVQWAMFVASLLLLAYAIFRCGGSALLSAALVAPLFFSDTAAGYLPVMLPEVPSLALAVASVALLLLAVNEPLRWRWWFGLSAAVFGSYQSRPAFLFLVPLVPLMAIVVARILEPRRHVAPNHNPPRKRGDVTGDVTGRVPRLRFGLLAAASVAAVGPFLCFCFLRLAVVGHFGLVSFGGINIVGITGSLLDEQTLPHLSDESRMLATHILAHRSGDQQHAFEQENQAKWNDATYELGGMTIADYNRIDRLYNATIHSVARPAARELFGEDPVKTNAAMSQLSREVILHMPLAYMSWIVQAIGHAVWVAATLLAMLGMWALLAVVGSICAWKSRRHRDRPDATQSTRFDDASRRAVLSVTVVAVAFFLAKTLLVSLVEPTIPRYIRPAAVFLPMPLAAILYAWTTRLVTRPRIAASTSCESSHKTIPVALRRSA